MNTTVKPANTIPHFRASPGSDDSAVTYSNGRGDKKDFEYLMVIGPA